MLDVVAVGAVVGVGLTLWVVVGVPAPPVALLLLAAGAVYWRSRPPLVQRIDRLVFGERLQRASLAVIEAERGRLARDIHDEPLQELGAIIRRLEVNPETADEVRGLRDVASHLRAAAADLHPPVLDDLGLGAAIGFVVRQANVGEAAIQVVNRLEDHTEISRDRRAPTHIELALFRIVQEAVGNAQRHSRGTRIDIEGVLTHDHAELTIRDNGVGLQDADIERALRTGRLGLAFMRDRAATIGAALRVGRSARGGTAITVSWKRQ